MNKGKRVVTIFVVFAFLFSFTAGNAHAAIRINGIIIPRPSISGMVTSYKVGSRISASIISADIRTPVQYRAVLKNVTTGKSTDIFKGFTSRSYSPQYKFPLAITVSTPGKYLIMVTSKKAGYKTKYSTTTTRGFTVVPNVISPGKLLSIYSITNEINEGDSYKLPQNVIAKYERGTAQVAVNWKNNLVNTDKPGTYVYEGSASGYSGIVKLTLIIKPVELTYNLTASYDLNKVYVTFNKIIDKNSITSENIKLSSEGKIIETTLNLVDDKKICITASNTGEKLVSDGKYNLSLVGVCDLNGNKPNPDSVEFIPSKIVDRNLVGTIKAGYLESPEIYNPLGQFLYFAHIPINAKSMGARYDSNGIPLVKINNKYVYDPVSIAQYGLQYYSYYIKDGNKDNIKYVTAVANWLVSSQDKRTGKWLYNFPFDVGGMNVRLNSGWACAMGQGQAISLLVRAYNLTKNERYIQTAELGLKPLKVNVINGGLTRYFNGHPFYEEYPTNPPSYALNGFMFTLLGLYDLSYIRPGSEATKLYNDGMNTLKYMLPYYDSSKNKISIYHLGYITKPPRSIHTSSFYHLVHIIQLKSLDSISPDPTLQKYYYLWKSYIE